MNPFLQKLYTWVGYEPHSALAFRSCVDSPLSMLPAMGEPAFRALPEADCAAPCLWEQKGESWLFCEKYEEGRICIAAGRMPLQEAPQTVLRADTDLRSPALVKWRGVLYLLVVNGESVALYRCKEFPTGWELAQRFTPAEAPGNVMVLAQTPDTLTLLTNTRRADAPQQTRYRRSELRPAMEDETGLFTWREDETFNLQNREFDTAHSAGSVFAYGGQNVRPVRMENGPDPCYLQFYCGRLRGPNSKEMPMCASTIYNLLVEGLVRENLTGVTGYARNREWEVVVVEYLERR